MQKLITKTTEGDKLVLIGKVLKGGKTFKVNKMQGVTKIQEGDVVEEIEKKKRAPRQSNNNSGRCPLDLCNWFNIGNASRLSNKLSN